MAEQRTMCLTHLQVSTL